MAGYKFIMQNYRDGDKICLFGVLTCVSYFPREITYQVGRAL